jgi:hypothetical protein
LLQNKIIWRQKSRELWLKEGDKNSRFFHTSTIIRRRKNSVDLIRGDDGEWILDKKKISENFLSKFKTLFIEEEIDFPIDLENLIQPSLTFEENQNLCTIPTALEIKDTLFEILVQKALGPNRIHVLFYK